MSSPVHTEARRLADHLGTIIPRDSSPFFATVSDVTSGVVTVTRFGTQLLAGGGYPNSYTPQVNDRVKCSYVDGQLCVDGKYIGQP